MNYGKKATMQLLRKYDNKSSKVKKQVQAHCSKDSSGCSNCSRRSRHQFRNRCHEGNH